MKLKNKEEKGKIKAIIFDIGGVLIFYDHIIAAIKLSRITGISPEKIVSVLSSEKGKFTIKSDLGASIKEYWNIAEKEFKIKIKSPEKFQELWNTIFWPNMELLSLTKKLKKDYKLAILSNINVGHKKYLLKEYSLKKYFNVIVLSCDAKTRKPGSKIFKIALKKLNVKPNEAIFIDNLIANIKGAREVGINGIHFKNNEQLFKDLEKLGIKV